MSIAKTLRNFYYRLDPDAKRRRKEAKREAKRQRFEASKEWERGDAFATRRYGSYEEYVEHQSSKLSRVAHRLDRNREQEIAEYIERFENVRQLKEVRNVLCLAARLGAEVEAFHRMGHFAIGTDLNPGENNAYVMCGDFHAIVFPDGSVDAVYCNAIDHAFDIEKLLSEIARVLRSRGIFIAEIETGFEEGHTPGDYESMHWRDSKYIIERMANAGGLAVEEVQDLGQTRRNNRKLIVYRKP